MCTAVACHAKDNYFGRNLDLEYSYEETVTITPRKFPFLFRKADRLMSHYAIIGMAYVNDGYPLYYDGMNEKGLAMAGLNFPGNAVYQPEKNDYDNIAPFELIPWILGRCANLQEAKEQLLHMNLVKLDFSSELPLSPLHWMLSDKTGSLVIEPAKEGLLLYENPVEVLTNNPSFPVHMWNLSNYMSLSNKQMEGKMVKLPHYSRGMGAIGLPGDASSASRFVRAVYTSHYSVWGELEEEAVSQFFHVLSSVEQQKGCTELERGEYEITVYSGCCNLDKGIYYYKTYENSRIIGVDMGRENLDGKGLISYPLLKKTEFQIQNG